MDWLGESNRTQAGIADLLRRYQDAQAEAERCIALAANDSDIAHSIRKIPLP